MTYRVNVLKNGGNEVVRNYNSINFSNDFVVSYANKEANVSVRQNGLGNVCQTVCGKIPQLFGTSIIPLTNNIPSISDGAELWKASIAPKAASSKVLLQFNLVIDCSAKRNVVVSVFRGNVCIGGSVTFVDSVNGPQVASLTLVDSPKSTSAVTYSARIGVDSSATWYANQTRDATLGGVMASNSFVLWELS